MATVYKREGSKFWQIAWFDHAGKRHTKSSRTTDHAAAVRISKKYDSDTALKREGVIDPRAEAMAKHSAATIKSHLDAFQSFQASKSKPRHIETTRKMIELICDECGYSVLRDIEPDGVSEFAATLRKENRSLRTIESYLQAIKSFTRWAVKTGKLPSDPLVTVSKPSPESDRRLVRRFMTHDEFHWLDAVTRTAGDAYGMTGTERALLYSTAIQTGLRAGELASLTRGKMQLTAKPPFILAEARSTKNNQLARQYIQPELADELAKHVSRKVGGSKVFNMPRKWEVVEMFRADLSAARSEWLKTIADPQKRIEADAGDFMRVIDSEGESLDFHALRHTTASWLIQSGADVKTLQSVMRHSDIKLTLQRYGHLFPGSEAAAVSRIRTAFSNPLRLSATGTDSADCQRSCQQSASEPVRKVGVNCNSVRNEQEEHGAGKHSETKGKTRKFVSFPWEKTSTPERIRTSDRRIRNPVLADGDNQIYQGKQGKTDTTPEDCQRSCQQSENSPLSWSLFIVDLSGVVVDRIEGPFLFDQALVEAVKLRSDERVPVVVSVEVKTLRKSAIDAAILINATMRHSGTSP
jgi:integrase